LEKQFEAFKTCSRLRSKIHPGVRLLGHFLGTVFGDVSKKPGFQNGTPFGPLAIETPIGGAGRGVQNDSPICWRSGPVFGPQESEQNKEIMVLKIRKIMVQNKYTF
jgi:hypothetical protein